MTFAKAVHLERELMRVEFAASQLVSDHSERLGGSGKGASPGELLLAGLTAATVLGVRDAATRQGLPLGAVVVRAGLRSDREGAQGALGAISFLGQISRRIELVGPIANEAGEGLTEDLGFGRTLEHGVSLEEDVAFAPASDVLRLSAWRNTALEGTASNVPTLSKGARETGVDSGWRVHATEAGPGLALVQLSGAPILVSADGRLDAPTPYELLLASLAACTTIFVARYSRLHEIPLQSVAATARADVNFGDGCPVARIEKSTMGSGRLDSQTEASCRFFADHCAIGESLKRGISLRSETWIRNTGQGVDATAGSRPPIAELLASDVECDGLSCCVA
jgi:uncharacterized OsmC-like protein